MIKIILGCDLDHNQVLINQAPLIPRGHCPCSSLLKVMDQNEQPAFPEIDFDFSRKGRGTYSQDSFSFQRGDDPYLDAPGRLQLRSKRGGDAVVAKLYSDLDGDGRFSKDELIFKGASSGEDVYDRLNDSSGKIRWDYNDCTPCLRLPFNVLTLNPIGAEKVDFFSIGFMETMEGLNIGDHIEII